MMTRKTSLDAYRKIQADGLLSKRRFEVYSILFEHAPLTAHEVVAIARKKYPLSNQTSFNARLSELRTLGCVETVGEKINETSGTMNLLWDVTGNLPIKPAEEKIEFCSHCKQKLKKGMTKNETIQNN